MKRLFFLLLLLLGSAKADVVKPALVEVSLFSDYRVEVAIELSLEAAMSDIGTQYKNTQDAPSSDYYDELRALEPAVLRQRFDSFSAEFQQGFDLKLDGQSMPLSLIQAEIDIIGYKKRPRKTRLVYEAQFKRWPSEFRWQYIKRYGDSALRWQIYQADSYNWSQWTWLREGAASESIELSQAPQPDMLSQVSQFIGIGFDHVIPLGWDHILFIVGMALSSLVFRNLLLLTLTFTVAHTLTLGLAAADLVNISARIVEPLIAFSIAYVALENLSPRFVLKRKTVWVFVFGLVHGLGFASMLREFEMVERDFLTTLISFNIGVELAQVLVVVLTVLPLLLLRTIGVSYRQWAVMPISILIAVIGLWWGIERLIG